MATVAWPLTCQRSPVDSSGSAPRAEGQEVTRAEQVGGERAGQVDVADDEPVAHDECEGLVTGRGERRRMPGARGQAGGRHPDAIASTLGEILAERVGQIGVEFQQALPPRNRHDMSLRGHVYLYHAREGTIGPCRPVGPPG
jgi:hypothetical protein